MSNKNAAIELLERELEECERRAEELRDAIRILSKQRKSILSRDSDGLQDSASYFVNRSTRSLARKILEQYPKGLSTQGLWKEISKRGGEVSNPNSLNAILNRHDDVFTRHPDQPRLWTLTMPKQQKDDLVKE